jgi:hypothetical protein
MKSLILLVLLLNGCSSLQNKVNSNVHEGDSANDVLHALGTPNELHDSSQNDKEMSWFYYDKSDGCRIKFNETTVSQITCYKQFQEKRRTASYTPYFNGLGQIGQGLKTSVPNQPQPVSCNSWTDIGGVTHTDCN